MWNLGQLHLEQMLKRCSIEHWQDDIQYMITR